MNEYIILNNEYILNNLVKDDLPEVRKIISYTDNLNSAKKGNSVNGSSTTAITKDVPANNLYKYIVRELSQDTRNTEEQLKYLNIFETALSVYRVAALTLRKEMDILGQEYLLETQRKSVDDILNAKPENGQLISGIKPTYNKQELISNESVDNALRLGTKISSEKFLSNRYALYFAGKVGLSMLGEKNASTEIRYSFGSANDASTDRNLQTQMLAMQTKEDLEYLINDMKEQQKVVTDANFKDILQTVFTTWVNQFNWQTYGNIIKETTLDNVMLRFDNFTIRKGDFKEKYTNVIIDPKMMNIDKSMVIGAEGKYSDGTEKLGTVLWNEAKLLTGYNHDLRSNIHNPASVIFTTGVPGCGKTFTAQAYIRSFANLCKENNIPVWVLTHSTTDYASEYQNATSNALDKLAQEINDFPGIVLGYVADADNIFMSRKANLTAEQQNTMNVYFKMFDGSLIPKNGKCLWIMDANYIESIDDATKSRVFDRIVEMRRFEDANDFAKLAKFKITGGKNNLLHIEDADWLSVGNALLASPLSNREIDHVFTKVVSYDLPEHLIGKPFSIHESYKLEELKKINAGTIHKTLEDYIAKRADIEAKSQAARESQDAERFDTFLSNLTKEHKDTNAK